RIVVTGQVANLRNALDAQQAADHIVSVLSADGIGQLPDINAAEALQRLPGVSVERDQGEGRYVRIRGLGADLNSVTLNGALVPAPESDRRGVMLDVLPAGLIRSLEVSKTLTPDRDANAIGGTIEVKTLSAFDQPGPFLSMEGGASRDGNTGQVSPRLGVAWSDRFMAGTLGVSAGLSLDRRRFGSDNVETGGAWDGDTLEEFEQRDYRITRDRQALTLNLEWRPETGRKFTLNTFVSRFADEEHREARIVEFDDAQASGQRGDADVSRELKARKETQSIRSAELGTELALGSWKLNAALGASRASEDEPQHIAGATFAGNDTFADTGFDGSRQPRLAGPAGLHSAGSYSLDEIELGQSLTVDREQHLRIDLSRPWQLAGFDGLLKWGGKWSERKKTSDGTTWKVESGDLSGDLGMAAFSSGTVDYALGAFGPGLSADRLSQRLAGVTLADFEDEEESRLADFRVDERIQAAYLMSTLDFDDWRLLGGVRYEGTRTTVHGTGLTDGDFSSISQRTERDDWLPSLHLRRDFGKDTSLRAAWTQAVVRPNFGQLAPGFVIDGDEAEFGNPALKPMKANNLDLGLERRLGRDGAASVYLFHKRIADTIYRTDLAGTGAWASFDQAETWVNGGQATVRGIELSWSEALRSLPAPFNGLIVGANASFTRSSATISRFDSDSGEVRSRRTRLPSQSDRSINLMLGYEAGPLSLRLAANHKSDYLLEVADVLDASQDQIVAGQTQIDFSARWQLDKRWQLSLELQNLSDQPYYVYQGSSAFNAQHEQYGRSLRVGVKFALY
ncbi:TonB-dependent receptor, partial [Ideonella sp.]|uniref:TonB-dependent receptor n=1 Tax=Ideonella sp. TaxID=1929293 RepID=UPI003BB68B74